jgi:type IV pilus assembly protein PilV
MKCFYFKKPPTSCSRFAQERGSTLIEVLVTAVVMAVGLLGIAGLQLNSLKTNNSSYMRSQSAISAYNLMDSIRANRESAIGGDYDIAMSAFSDLSTPSQGASIAETDRYNWYQELNKHLTNAQAAIDCDATAVCVVKVQWDDSHAEGATSTKHIVLTAQI